MGYGFTPYSVDLDAVRRVFGSKDEALLTAVIASQELPDDDTEDEGDEDLDEDEGEEDDNDEEDSDDDIVVPSSQEVLRLLVMGEPFARGCASKYGYVFKALCQHLGKRLPNEQWEQTRDEFVEGFDGVLKKLGVPQAVFRIGVHLLGRKDPVPLPRRGDFPNIGHLTKEEVVAVGQTLAAIDPAAVLAAGDGIRVRRQKVEAEFVVQCLDEIRGWCQACAADGRALVVFYH